MGILTLIRRYRNRDSIKAIDCGMEGLNNSLSWINMLRWRIVRMEEFEGKTDMLRMVEDMRFLAEDSLRRMARCRILYKKGEPQSAAMLWRPVPGQLELVNRKCEEFEAFRTKICELYGGADSTPV